MAKSKGKEEVTESFTWEVTATLIASSQEALEALCEAVEENLDNANDVDTDLGEIDDYTVRMT
jgi:hypothetical protein